MKAKIIVICALGLMFTTCTAYNVIDGTAINDTIYLTGNTNDAAFQAYNSGSFLAKCSQDNAHNLKCKKASINIKE